MREASLTNVFVLARPIFVPDELQLLCINKCFDTAKRFDAILNLRNNNVKASPDVQCKILLPFVRIHVVHTLSAVLAFTVIM